MFVYLFNFVMFQPYYCTAFYFSFLPRLAKGYFKGKDQLWHVSKVFLVKREFELRRYFSALPEP